jgi:cystathionine beta-lyase
LFAMGCVLGALTDKNDSVMILEPVYYPFAKITIGNDRNLVISNLKLDNNRYVIDFEDFEHKVVKHKAKLLLLCSPHNPVGRVWTKEELLEIARICLKYGVIIVSDEIHSDFVYKGYRHIPIASLSEEILNSTITCTSPSKTFNIAGLQVSNIVIENQDLRRKVWKACLQTGYSSLNTMAICATKAAYKYGHLWLDALMDYLEDNVNLVQNVLCSKSGITLIRPEATYLMWLDCRNMNLDQDNLDSFFISKLGLWLSSGSIFGESGNGFMRMNIATQRSVLHEALHRIDMEIQ